MGLTLRVLNGTAAGTTHELSGPGAVLIGRSARCGLVLPSGNTADLRVSHTHALVEFDPPHCRVFDLHSRNGTKVNGVTVSAGELKGGDVLTVGATQIRLEMQEDVPAVESSEDPFVTLPLPDGSPPSTVVAPSEPCAACRKAAPLAGGVLCGGCEQSAADLVQRVPGYRLVREIGRGNLGVTYLAVLGAGRRVAVKAVHTPDTVHPSQLARFLGELAPLRELRHPHIVRHRDAGVMSGGAFVVAEYVHGMDLRRVLRRWGPMSVANAVRAVRLALSGVAHAHALGVVHGDLKPSNLLLEVRSKRQGVKITDFGLARAYHAAQLGGATTGGSPVFLPPERIANPRTAEPAADQYSMAATLYHLLSGEHPFDTTGPAGVVLDRVLHEDPVPILERRPHLSRALALVIQRAMSRDPADRFESVEDFRAALEPFAGG
jgi:eukaryotic-like serine/threonine-protein kinase